MSDYYHVTCDCQEQSDRGESNPHNPDPQSSALPLSYGHIGVGGIEPTISRSQTERNTTLLHSVSDVPKFRSAAIHVRTSGNHRYSEPELLSFGCTTTHAFASVEIGYQRTMERA